MSGPSPASNHGVDGEAEKGCQGLAARPLRRAGSAVPFARVGCGLACLVAVGWAIPPAVWAGDAAGERASRSLPRVEPENPFGQLDDAGLYGSADGLRALDYEYCIPRQHPYRDEVTRIDPTAAFHEESPGRAGCGPNEVRVTGNTHQVGFRSVLERLSDLAYVARILPVWFE